MTSRVLKFVKKLRARGKVTPEEIQASDVIKAEKKWIQLIQDSSFPEELENLRADRIVVYTNQFILFLEDGIIHCRCHVNQADLPHQAKNPILLLEKHHFSELVIKEKHMLVHHNGIWNTSAAT